MVIGFSISEVAARRSVCAPSVFGGLPCVTICSPTQVPLEIALDETFPTMYRSGGRRAPGDGRQARKDGPEGPCADLRHLRYRTGGDKFGCEAVRIPNNVRCSGAKRRVLQRAALLANARAMSGAPAPTDELTAAEKNMEKTEGGTGGAEPQVNKKIVAVFVLIAMVATYLIATGKINAVTLTVIAIGTVAVVGV